jgi:hypothetical protein
MVSIWKEFPTAIILVTQIPESSVYGYVLYFCGASIAWNSKAGKSVTLQSTEAEYNYTSETAKEVIFHWYTHSFSHQHSM